MVKIDPVDLPSAADREGRRTCTMIGSGATVTILELWNYGIGYGVQRGVDGTTSEIRTRLHT